MRGEEREEQKGREERETLFEGPWWRYPPMRNALLSGGLLAVGFSLARLGLLPRGLELIAYIAAILLGGYYWAREGLEGLLEELKVGIEILMGAATIGAAVLGAWEEAAFLVFLYGAAEALEEYTFARTRSAIRALLDLAPREARVLKDGTEVAIPATELIPGDLFVVRPGEAIPTDGIIRKGSSTLNEAPVTGESLPVEKGPGNRVFAGTLNHQGALEVEAITRFEDNTLSKIIHLVEEAQEEKGQAQRFIERFGRRYSPAVLLTAFLFLIVPPLFDVPFQTWATRAVVLLVAAAPCALVMSTPVAIAAGIGTAGRNGVLIKGGMHLENLGLMRVVAFDKTGTLTEGRPVVTDLLPFDGHDRVEVLRLAASVEHLSEHPLAQAIVHRAQAEGLHLIPVQAFEALTGAGAKATLNGQTFYVGSPALFVQLGAPLEQVSPSIARFQAEGKTVVLIGTKKEIHGVIALQDRPRPGTRAVIQALHGLGVEKVVMLTGDHRRTAETIARDLGIDGVYAELKPEEKVRRIRELEASFGRVAMVGDGVNDAPALAAATVGIAMGAAGTDAAIEAADVALMADDVTKVVYALRLGRRAQRISRQNIVFSLLILAVLIPTAVSDLLTVAVAVTAHEVSELLAIANGLRVAR